MTFDQFLRFSGSISFHSSFLYIMIHHVLIVLDMIFTSFIIYSFTSPVIITRYDIISSIPNLYHSMIKNYTFDITCTLDLTHLMSVFSYVPHHSHTITLFSWPFDTILASLTLSSFFISSIRYHYNLPDLSFTHPSPSSRHINDQSSSLTHLNMYSILWYFVSTLGYYITKRIIQKEG